MFLTSQIYTVLVRYGTVPEMEIMAKYHQELIFISGIGMQVKNTVTEEIPNILRLESFDNRGRKNLILSRIIPMSNLSKCISKKISSFYHTHITRKKWFGDLVRGGAQTTCLCAHLPSEKLNCSI